MIFYLLVKHPAGGYFTLILRQDVNNYYLLRNTDGYGPRYLQKYVSGTLVDSANFLSEYSQNNNYSIAINFSPGQTTVNAFGESLTINTDSSNITVNSFEIETRQQDAYFDNISYTGSGSPNQEPDEDAIPPTIASISTDSSTQVIVVFSEPVEELSATNALNYGINNEIMVYGASLGSDQKSVTLTTSSHTEGTYTLTVNDIEDLASIPNVIAVGTTVSYTFLNQLHITNLNVVSGESYEVIYNGLQDGALVYIDKRDVYNTVPTWLEGDTYIKTADKDKIRNIASFFTFDVNMDVTVYVAHDDRITSKPSWLASFTGTGDEIVISGNTFSIFASYYSAGTITLGNNQGGRKTSMYTVVIVGQ